MERSRDEDRRFILDSKLYCWVDCLVSALLWMRPDNVEEIFGSFLDLLAAHNPDRYAEWLKQEQFLTLLEQKSLSSPVEQTPRVCRTSPRHKHHLLAPPTSPTKVVEQTVKFCDQYVAKRGDDVFDFQCKKIGGAKSVFPSFRLAHLFLEELGTSQGLPSMYDNVGEETTEASLWGGDFAKSCLSQQDIMETVQGAEGRRNQQEVGLSGAGSNLRILPLNQTSPRAQRSKGKGLDGTRAMPSVRFRSQLNQLSQLSLSSTVVISAERFKTRYEEYHSCEELSGAFSEMGISSLKDIFGPGEFKITAGEIRSLEKEIRIFTGPALPPEFFLKLIGIVSRDENVQYYSEHRDISLGVMSEATNPCELGRFIRDMRGCFHRPQRSKLSWEFTDITQAIVKQLCEQNLVELSTQVCVACPGYLFVGNDNQIIPKTEKKIIFISAAGINFNFGPSSCKERSKYFYSDSKGFIVGRREKLKERLRQMYHVLFKACAEYKVTHPTAIGIGLGMFLGEIERCAVMRLYHEAIFELLSAEVYGFHAFFLNPGPGTHVAESLRLTRKYTFKCKVVLHSRDGKALVANLAKAGFDAAYIYPSDFVAVIQGCAGNRWAYGTGPSYTASEDLVATSTAILARSNICSLWGAAEDRKESRDAALKRILSIPAPTPNVTATPAPAPSLQICHTQSFISARVNDKDPLFPLLLNGLKIPMYIGRVICVGLKDGPMADSLREFFNKLKVRGLSVQHLSSSDEVVNALKDAVKPPVSFVITNWFESEKDSSHIVVQKVHTQLTEDRGLFCRIVVVSFSGLSCLERSTLYTEGAHLVTFNLQHLRFTEILHKLLLLQRFNDRLCKLLEWLGSSNDCRQLVIEEEEKKTFRDMIHAGISLDHAHKSCACLHFLAAMDLSDKSSATVEHFFQSDNVDVDVPTRRNTIFKGSVIPIGATPLYVALAFGNVLVAQALLSSGASPFFHAAVPKSPLDLAEAMVAKDGSDAAVKIRDQLRRPLGDVPADVPLYKTRQKCVGVVIFMNEKLSECATNLVRALRSRTFCEVDEVPLSCSSPPVELAKSEVSEKLYKSRPFVCDDEDKPGLPVRAIILDLGCFSVELGLHIQSCVVGFLKSCGRQKMPESFPVLTIAEGWDPAGLEKFKENCPRAEILATVPEMTATESSNLESVKRLLGVIDKFQPRYNPSLSVLWIFIGEKDPNTTAGFRARQKLSILPSLFNVLISVKDFMKPTTDWEAEAEKHAVNLLDHVKPEWLQAIVFELHNDVHFVVNGVSISALRIWEILLGAMVRHRVVKDSPWARIFAFTEDFEGCPYDAHDGDLLKGCFPVSTQTTGEPPTQAALFDERHSPVVFTADKGWLGCIPSSSGSTQTTSEPPSGDALFIEGDSPVVFTSGKGRLMVFAHKRLETAQTQRNSISGKPDPEIEKLNEFRKKMTAALLLSVTHWAWDCTPDSVEMRECPYSAKLSSQIEAAYRDGRPSVDVTEPESEQDCKHRIYFNEMVQRREGKYSAVRLVFRHPVPCFDCDAVVRRHPHLLREIV
eukprot:RCo041248